MSEPEVPGDEPVAAPDVPVEAAPVDPAPVAAEPTPDPAVDAVASGDIDVSLIAFRGGPRDSTTGVLPGHDILSFETDTGETYTRSDQQEGNFRIYTFTPPVGEAPDATRTFAGPEVENKLEADLAQIQADAATLETDAKPEDEPAS